MKNLKLVGLIMVSALALSFGGQAFGSEELPLNDEMRLSRAIGNSDYDKVVSLVSNNPKLLKRKISGGRTPVQYAQYTIIQIEKKQSSVPTKEEKDELKAAKKIHEYLQQKPSKKGWFGW